MGCEYGMEPQQWGLTWLAELQIPSGISLASQHCGSQQNDPRLPPLGSLGVCQPMTQIHGDSHPYHLSRMFGYKR